ncbi:MAG: bifunctional UDP-sugar hydrolase/5'-nucleotidase [Bacteroidales bacterium]|nr:bifunctional UDP-sugar hydrolase/5'-nucleotidase [Bacteroidales bacterium]
MMKFSTKLNVIYAIVLFSTSLLISCSTSQKVKVGELPKLKTLEILAVNDIHAALENFPRFAFMLDSLRAIYPNLLLVSAGDNQTGHPANDQYPEKGMPIIELMNVVKFDLSAVGNHEFDLRIAGFENLTHKAQFDFLCANMEIPKNVNIRIKPYKIVETHNGLKIAFVSFLDINENGIPDTHPDNVKGFSFNDPFKTAQEYLFLKDSCDVFVMLNHLGFEEDVKLAMQLPAKSVDVIIGGHSHTKVEKDQIHNGIMITQADRKLKYATLIKFTVSSEKKVDREMSLLAIGKKGNSRADIQEMVEAYNNNPALTKTIAIAEDDFSNYEEVGFLMVDAIRMVSGTDIAFINPGGVRVSSLAKGPVLTKNVYEMDPFGNEIVLFNLSGHEMRNLFLAAFELDDFLPIYPSGMTTRYLLNSDGSLKNVELFTSDGKPLDMDKTYSVVMNDYMASSYKYEHKDPGQGLFRTSAEATIDYLKNLKNIPSYRGMLRVEMVR